jgi:hypothetical protein
MSEPKETTFKTNGAPPIPQPEKNIEEEVPEINIEEPIPEYDVSNYEENIERTPLTPEEENERKVIIRKLHLWLNAFPGPITNLRGAISDSIDMTIVDLRRLLEDVEYMVARRSSSLGAQKMFVGGVNVFELLTTKMTPLKVNGLTKMVKGNGELLEIVEELSIKYSDGLPTSPESRLAFCMAQLIMELHTVNTINEQINKSPQEIEVRSEKLDKLAEGL